MPKQAYRVAVIGRTGKGDYGHFMEQFWRHVGGLEVVALADEDEKGRAEAAKRAGAARTHADWRQMLAREKPQFVSVGPRWSDAHLEIITACIEAGAHIYTEKPLVPTLAEADQIVAAAESKGVKIAVAHHLRYIPEMDLALKMIADGVIGDVLELRASCKEDRRGGGEDFLLLGSHVIEATRMVLGEPRMCFARVLQDGRPATRLDVHDATEPVGPVAGDRIDAMYYGFDGAAPAYVTSTRGAGNSARFGLRILGSKGGLAITPAAGNRLHHLDEPNWSRPGKGWQPVEAQPDAAAGQLPDAHWLHVANVRAARDLIDAVENDRQPRCSVYDARATLEMILAVYESHRVSGPVPLPLSDRTHPLTRWT